jgi:hypothetical protein
MKNNIKAQHWILKWMDNNPNHTKEEALIALEKANYMSLKGALESKNSQYVDFSNPNADKITSGVTNRPMETKQTAVEYIVNVVNSCIAHDYIPNEIVKQAKAMEKEQIIQSIIDTIVGSNDIYDKEYPEIRHCAEKYYNENYGKENGKN